MEAEVVKQRGSLSSRMYYAIKIDGYILQMSDRWYSRMLSEKTGLDEPDHGHKQAQVFFQKIADKINA